MKMKYALMVPFDVDEDLKTGYEDKYQVYRKFASLKDARKYQSEWKYQYAFLVRILEVYGGDGEKVKSGCEHV